MFDNYIIEIRPKPAGRTMQAGIVVRDGRAFRFFAAADVFYALERQLFKNPKDAEEAALRAVATDHDAEVKKSDVAAHFELHRSQNGLRILPRSQPMPSATIAVV